MFDFFSTKGFKSYTKQAQRILDNNWTGNYTKPAPRLYPHQWNWDSGFIAIGYSRYNENRAMTEIQFLFKHQWENGMVPQIVFDPAALGNYFPEPEFWLAPEGKLTSGITMPPLHATACLHIYEHAKNGKNARDFLKYIFPQLLASHRYLYHYRNPDNAGLVYIRHPWESGVDNSPSWDKPLMNIQVDQKKLPPYERKDLNHGVPAEQRPSDEHYDRYVYLVDLFRRNNYDEAEIYEQCPFLIQDVLFNSVLCRADRDLIEIGKIIGHDTKQIEEWYHQTSRAIQNLMWSSDRNQFDPIDLASGKQLPTATAASFMPLFAVAASQEQAELLYNRLNSVSFCALNQGNCFTIPNYDMACDDFDSKNYWRGPVWININWMLSQGLKSYGFKEKSDSMKKDLIQLPIRFGFHEYFDSITGKGYGSKAFSWTSALFIDLVYEYYNQDKKMLIWFPRANSSKLKEKLILNHTSKSTRGHRKDLASKLMSAIGDLKETFYDMHRGRVDYKAMKNSDAYRDYLELSAELKAFDLNNLMTREDKLAFWINLYNTIVVQGIIELELESSVREVINFFTHICYSIDRYTFSPDEIEHGILRANSRTPYSFFPIFRRDDPRDEFALYKTDPRIHFALVCGSRSCAPIRFYQKSVIDEQLDTATKNFVNSSEVVILPEKNKVLLSQIFHWYAKDFGKRKDLFRFLLHYLNPDEKTEYLERNIHSIDVEYLFYDWNLNH